MFYNPGLVALLLSRHVRLTYACSLLTRFLNRRFRMKWAAGRALLYEYCTSTVVKSNNTRESSAIQYPSRVHRQKHRCSAVLLFEGRKTKPICLYENLAIHTSPELLGYDASGGRNIFQESEKNHCGSEMPCSTSLDVRGTVEGSSSRSRKVSRRFSSESLQGTEDTPCLKFHSTYMACEEWMGRNCSFPRREFACGVALCFRSNHFSRALYRYLRQVSALYSRLTGAASIHLCV